MTGFEFDSAQTAQSQALIGEHQDTVAQAAQQLSAVAYGQNERKWGIEDGALTYRESLIGNAQMLHDEVQILTRRAQNFTDALRACVSALEATEADATAAQQKLLDQLAAMPLAPEAPDYSPRLTPGLDPLLFAREV